MCNQKVLLLAVIWWLLATKGPIAADPQPKLDLYGDLLPSAAIARLGTVRFRHHGELKCVTYSADGESLIGFSSETVLVWDAKSGHFLRELAIHRHYVQLAAVSRDCARAVTAGHHVDEAARQSLYTLKIWDLTDGPREFATVSLAGDSRVSCVAIDAEGGMVATGDSRGTLRLFEVASGEELLSYAVAARDIRSLAFSPDGERLLISDGREPLRIWHWADGGKPDRFGEHPHLPVACEWSHDGALVAVAHYGEEGVHILDAKNGAMLAKIAQGPFFDAVRFIAFSPDDGLLATCDNGTAAVAFWDVKSGQLVRSVGQGARRAGRIVFSPDGRELAKHRSHPALIHTWNVATGQPSAFVQVGHQDPPTAIAFFPGDQKIATAGDDGTLRIWDVETGKQLRTCAHRPEDTGESNVTVWIRAMDISPDGRLVATSSQDNTDRIWDAQTGAEIHRLPGHGRIGGRRAARFSQDGQQLMTWGDDMSIRVWVVTTGKVLVEHPVRPSGVKIPENENGEVDFDSGDWNMILEHGAFSPDVSRFVLVYGSSDCYLYDVSTGEEINRITLDQSNIRSAAFAPNRDLMLLGGFGVYREIPLSTGGAFSRPENEFEVSLRQLPGGEPIAAWKLEGRMAGPVAFGPRGDVFSVATLTPGAPIRVYATDGAKLLAEIGGFNAIPYSLAFSHDGRLLASGLSDTTALVWDWRQFEK